MNMPKVFHPLLAPLLLTGCAANYASAEPLISSRPGVTMSQTDFVVRIVQFACASEKCKEVGTMAANVGNAGARATVYKMCLSHSGDSAGDTTRIQASCLERGLPALADPSFVGLWSECKSINDALGDNPNHLSDAIRCLGKAVDEASAAGADTPIMQLGSARTGARPSTGGPQL
jgi:hypothetical protein